MVHLVGFDLPRNFVERDPRIMAGVIALASTLLLGPVGVPAAAAAQGGNLLSRSPCFGGGGCWARRLWPSVGALRLRGGRAQPPAQAAAPVEAPGAPPREMHPVPAAADAHKGGECFPSDVFHTTSSWGAGATVSGNGTEPRELVRVLHLDQDGPMFRPSAAASGDAREECGDGTALQAKKRKTGDAGVERHEEADDEQADEGWVECSDGADSEADVAAALGHACGSMGGDGLALPPPLSPSELMLMMQVRLWLKCVCVCVCVCVRVCVLPFFLSNSVKCVCGGGRRVGIYRNVCMYACMYECM